MCCARTHACVCALGEGKHSRWGTRAWGYETGGSVQWNERQARYSHPYHTCTHNLGHKAGLTCGCRAPTSTVTNAPMSDAESGAASELRAGSLANGWTGVDA